jgi:hypothetical protein
MNVIRRYPLPAYVALAYGITWGAILACVALPGAIRHPRLSLKEDMP